MIAVSQTEYLTSSQPEVISLSVESFSQRDGQTLDFSDPSFFSYSVAASAFKPGSIHQRRDRTPPEERGSALVQDQRFQGWGQIWH